MQKDTTTKRLESKNDIFSEIFNVFLYRNKEELKIKPDSLIVLVPVNTLVLCYDNKQWNQPTTLRGLTDSNSYAIYMQDYGITVINIKQLSKEVRDCFTNDYKCLLDTLCEGEIPEYDLSEELKYPIETLDTIYVYTGDERCKDIKDKISEREMKGEIITMGSVTNEIHRRATIETAKVSIKHGVTVDQVISILMDSLQVDKNEAMNIFNTEVNPAVQNQ